MHSKVVDLKALMRCISPPKDETQYDQQSMGNCKTNEQKVDEIVQFFLVTNLHHQKIPHIMEYVAYMVSVNVILLFSYDLRRSRFNKREEVEEEIFSRYLDVLT